MKTLFDRNLTVGEVQELINNGANVNETDNNGFTPLHYVEDLYIARLLIAHKANVNAKTINGTTPLHFKENMDVIRLLVESGADVNAKTTDGTTPLKLAMGYKERVKVNFLISKGARV